MFKRIKSLFNFKDDPDHVVIYLAKSKIWDHSGLEALHNVTERYHSQNKKLHLLNLSPACMDLLRKAENIVELSVINDPGWNPVLKEKPEPKFL